MIRAATPADAPAIAALHVRAWHWNYADLVPADRMPTLEERTATWARPFPGAIWVLEADGRVAGVAAARPDGELAALYVDPPAQGAGVGTALLAHAEVWLAAEGNAAGRLWALEGAGQAIAFYERRGWVRDGRREERFPPSVSIGYAKDLCSSR